MAIISENKPKAIRLYGSTQLRYAVAYVCITLVALIFLNIYTSTTSQQLFYKSKEASMLDKCTLAAAEISQLEVLNAQTVGAAVAQMDTLDSSRLIVTNHAGMLLYDTYSAPSSEGDIMLLPEIVDALRLNDTFSCIYNEGKMHASAAVPVLSYGTLVGCVYLSELDQELGMVIQLLEKNVISISIALIIVVIIFSITFSQAFSSRVRKIMTSMRIIREGDYSHKVDMGGNDELTVLGQEFNDLTDRLRTSENKRRQFVSDASHELKTPLASIKLLADSILQNDMDMDTVREFVSDIGNEADRLNRMSQKLLSLSRIESQEDGDCEIVPMAPTVERVTRMLNGIAKKNQITIVQQLQDDCPILILEDDLYQITFNLVENGIKYNVPGGKLTIRLRRDADNAILQVCDTGVGIPEDAIDHVFERFYRVDKARSRKSGGSGLGLAIVRNMVRRNGGTIEVTSVVDQGTTFTVTFPSFDTEED